MEAAPEVQWPPRSGRAAVVAFGVVVVVTVGYFVLGMPGMDHSGGTMTSMDHAASGDPMPLAPQAFADRLRDSSAFVINVHVPAGPSISGTDATIPYDRVVDDEALPADKDTPILLYCQTGRMSQSAGRTLVAASYTDVSHLDGGMEAWQRAGLSLKEQ